MLNIQGRLNSVIHSAAKAKQFVTAQNYMKSNTPEAIAGNAEKTVAAYEDFLKKQGRKITGAQRDRIDAAIKDQQKRHASAVGKLFENNPSSENFDRLFRGIGSPELQRKLDARNKAARQRDIRSLERDDLEKHQKKVSNQRQKQGELTRHGKK